MKKLLTIIVFLLSFAVFSQEQLTIQQNITLEEAISIAQKNSPDYKALLNQNQASYPYTEFK